MCSLLHKTNSNTSNVYRLQLILNRFYGRDGIILWWPTSHSILLLQEKGKWTNKQRVLVFSSRGVSYRSRHLMLDLRKLMAHSKQGQLLKYWGHLLLKHLYFWFLYWLVYWNALEWLMLVHCWMFDCQISTQCLIVRLALNVWWSD